MNKVAVFGGSNIDHIAKSNKRLNRHDSNIGKISSSFGGVGFNIASNLSYLGEKVIFFSALGNDKYGEDISQELSNNEIEVISPSSKLPTAQYLAIHDENGTMDVAICDASINSVMTIDFVEEHIEKLKEVEYVLIETNLEEKFIVDLVDTLKDKKIVVEGVSLAKVVKLKKVLDKVYLFKSNMKEAMEITSKNNEEDAIQNLIDLGVKNFVISNGKEDVIVYSSSKLTRIKATSLDNIVNETGAGDALISGIMSSLNRGKSLVDSVKDGILLSNKVLLISSSHLSKKDL